VNIIPRNVVIGPYYVRLVKDEYFRAYDSQTGERLAVINLTGKRKTKRRFVMVFVDVPSFTTDEKLSAFDKVLLMHLTWHMNTSNEVRLMQDELAKDLGVHQPTISKALKNLREARYVTCPRRGIIRVDPDFAWRDSLEANGEARKS
jgi:CRP-like cAMP-binding protein